MVLTLLPLTTTSRRRAWPCPCGSELAAAALCIAQPVKAITLAGALGTRSPLKDISLSPLCFVDRGASLQRLDRGVAPGGVLVIPAASTTMAASVPESPIHGRPRSPRRTSFRAVGDAAARPRAGNNSDRKGLRRPGGTRCHRRDILHQGRPAHS